MSSNDGQRLTVFGLTYKTADNRRMQHILREYGRLPENPGSRADLFVSLTALAKELGGDRTKVQGIQNWLENGGDFPSPIATNPMPEFGRSSSGNNATSLDGGFQANNPIGIYPLNARGFGRGLTAIPNFNRGNPSHSWGPGRRLDGTIVNDNPTPQPGMHIGTFGRPASTRTPRFPRPAGHRLDGAVIDNAEDEDMEDEFADDWNSDNEHRAHANHRQLIDDDDDDDEDMEDEDEDEDEDFAPRARPQRYRRVSIDTAFHYPTVGGNVQVAEEVPEGYIECVICTEVLPPYRFPESHNITASCNHEDESKVCLRCLEQTIRVPIDEGLLNLVTCPLCPEMLSGDDVKKYGSERIYARYQYLLMSLNPDMVFCLGPNCSSGQIHTDPSTNPLMTCKKCSFKTCVIHKLPWHENMTCEEFDSDESQIERLEQNEATAKLLAKLASKICPTCQQGVDRSDGCDHLRCRCGGEWCFECLASWENILRLGPTAHAPTCKNHPNKVNLRPDQKAANEVRILESVHGGKVSDTLQKARQERNARNRERIRPLALEAAEKRAQDEAKARKASEEQGGPSKKKKTRLLPAWEEK